MSNEHYLSKPQRDNFVNGLKSELQEIRQWLDEKKKEVGEEDRRATDEVDIANSYIHLSNIKAEISRKNERLKKIVETLKDMNDYGYCIDCGDEIGVERLEIDATFKRCFHCSSLNDIISRNYIKK
jgi:DnaK suppressor protein